MQTSGISTMRPQIWGKELFADVMDELYFMSKGLMGEDDNNVVQIRTGLKGKKGTKETIALTAKLTGNGVTGDDELEGNEQKIVGYSDEIEIDQWRDGVRLKGRLDEQKTAYNMRTDAKSKLKILTQEFMERQFFLKLAGVNNLTITDVSGVTVGARALWSNTPDVVPAADEAAGYGSRYVCANFLSGTDAMDSSHIMTTHLISYAKQKAKLANPKIQPLRIDGKDYYVMFLHPWQMQDLKESSTYMQAQLHAAERGKNNPIFTGMDGIWDGVILFEHEYVPFLDVDVAGNSFAGAATGTDAAVDCFRALLCGRQAAAFLECEYDADRWVEKTFDYENQVGFKTGIMGGIQKTTFNSKDYGVIAVDTTATPLI